MTDSPSPKPQGVVAVLVFPSGSEIASASDFQPSEAGGFSNLSRQKSRVVERLAGNAIRALCHHDVVKAISAYDAAQIVENLIRDCGYRRYIMPINYPEGDQ